MATNPFETLGLPERFDLTAEQVHRAYLSRIAALHPDLAAGEDPDEQDRRAAALNDARADLLDAERRAEALLTLRGGPGRGDDKALPPGFLMEILEVREAMEADLAAGDPGAREKWRAWGEARRRLHAEQLAPLLASATPESLRNARQVLNQWRYAERLLEQAEGRGSD